MLGRVERQNKAERGGCSLSWDHLSSQRGRWEGVQGRLEESHDTEVSSLLCLHNVHMGRHLANYLLNKDGIQNMKIIICLLDRNICKH